MHCWAYALLGLCTVRLMHCFTLVQCYSRVVQRRSRVHLLDPPPHLPAFSLDLVTLAPLTIACASQQSLCIQSIYCTVLYCEKTRIILIKYEIIFESINGTRSQQS